MNKKISIIGVNGKMGKWFANYFYKMGFEVVGFDTNEEIKEKFIEKANSLVSAILQIDYVLLCILDRYYDYILAGNIFTARSKHWVNTNWVYFRWRF